MLEGFLVSSLCLRILLTITDYVTQEVLWGFSSVLYLALEAPITTAADDNYKFCNIFPNFQKKGMIFHENRLPADDSHEISCLICYF